MVIGNQTGKTACRVAPWCDLH